VAFPCEFGYNSTRVAFRLETALSIRRKPLIVLDFRRSQHRDTRFRRERQHLLLLVLAFALALAVLANASHPETWRWLTAPSSKPSAAATGSQIDNRLADVAGESAISGGLTSPATTIIDDNAASANRAAKTGKTATDDGIDPGRLQLADASSISMDAVRDDTPSSVKEREPSLRLFCILENTSEAALTNASVGLVAYAQLFRQPESYRGKLVTVSGIVRRAQRLDIAPNPYDINAYYQVWLFPKDNSVSPMVVYCLRLPKDFPLGKAIAEDASLTGFFFKRCAYQAKDAVRTAPTLLAKTLHWEKRSAPSDSPTPPLATVLVIACGVLLTALLAGYIYWRSGPLRNTISTDQRPQFNDLHEAHQDSEGH